MDQMTAGLRWVAILPAWLIAMTAVNLVFIPISWIVYSFSGSPSDSFASYYMSAGVIVVNSIACGVAGIHTVACVAPKAKRETSFIVSAIVATLTVIVIVMQGMEWFSESLRTSEVIYSVLKGVPGVIAGFMIAAQIPRQTTNDAVALEHAQAHI